MKEIDPTLDVFSVSKAQKSLALDPSLVSCDVDEFETQAKLALERRDPATTIRAARRAEELYGGDLCRPTVDASGLISARRVELRSLYVDALVAGADAALQTGRDGLAVSFGREAGLRGRHARGRLHGLHEGVEGVRPRGRGKRRVREVRAARGPRPQAAAVARAPRPRQQEHGLLG